MGTHLMRVMWRGKKARERAAFVFMGRAGNMMEWWSMSHSGERGERYEGKEKTMEDIIICM